MFENGETPPDGNTALERLVGEGKKFKDAEALASGKEEADLFISQVTRENQELREKLKERLTLEDFMAELRQNNPRSEDGNHPDPDDEPTKGKVMTDEEFTSKVQALLDAKETKRIHASNEAYVKEELAKAFGPSYVSHVQAKARDLGVSTEFLGELAAKSPKVFLETVGAKVASSHSSVPHSSVRTDAQKGMKTYSHYRELMRKDPSLLTDQKFQMEIFQEAKKQGPAFYQQ